MLVCTLYHKKGLKSALNEVFAMQIRSQCLDMVIRLMKEKPRKFPIRVNNYAFLQDSPTTKRKVVYALRNKFSKILRCISKF